jgi:hypothetical protein
MKKSVSRPKIVSKKVTQSISLPVDVKTWLDSQEDSAGMIIERAVWALMNKKLGMFKNKSD